MTMPAAVGLAVGAPGETAVAPPVGIGDPQQQHKEKVRRLRGEDYPTEDAPEAEKVRYLRGLSEKTETESGARHRQAARNMLYAHGRQYLTFSKRTKSYEDLPLSEHEVRVTMNYIRPIMRSKSQRMLSGPVQFEAKADSNALDAIDRAKLGASLVQSRYEHTHMLAKLDQSLELAMTGGVACLKSFWNGDIGRLTPAMMKFPKFQPAVDPETGEPAMGPDGEPLEQPVMDANGVQAFEEGYVNEEKERVESVDEAFQYRPGDTDTAVRTVFNIRINPEATAWDPGSGLRWLLDSDVIAVEQAREMFPDAAERIKAMDENDAMAMTLERIAAGAATAGTFPATLQAQSAPNKKAGAGALGTTMIQEYWELPSSCYPKGRLMVRVGDVIVNDDVFPWGIFAYTPVFDEPAPMTPMGRPSVNDAVSPQDLINRQWASIDGEMRASGYSRFVSWDLPGIPEQITPEDRTVIRVPLNTKTMGKQLGQMFQRLDPGTVGGDRWKILDAGLRAMFDIFGFHEVSRGQVPPGVDSGVAIEHLLEEDRGQLAKAMRALEASLLDWGKKQLQIAAAMYGDTKRWLPIDRPDLGVLLEVVDGTKLPDPDSISLQLEGFKPQSDTAYRADVKWGLEQQLIDPRQALKSLDMGRGMNAIFDSQTRHYARAKRINLAIERGQYQVVPSEVPPEGALPGEPELLPQVVGVDGLPFVLPDDDDHLIHMLVLDEIILDDTRNPEARAVAQLVKSERRQIMQERALAAASEVPNAA